MTNDDDYQKGRTHHLQERLLEQHPPPFPKQFEDSSRGSVVHCPCRAFCYPATTTTEDIRQELAIVYQNPGTHPISEGVGVKC